MNNFSHITQLKIFKTCEYNPDQLDNSLMENEHEVCSQLKNSNLMISREKMECCKVRQIHLYHVSTFIINFYIQKIAHYVLLLFFSLRNEKELLLVFHLLYQNRFQMLNPVVI